MTRRLLTIAVGAPVIIAAVVLGAPWFDLMLIALALIISFELDGIAKPSHGFGLPVIFAAAALTLMLLAYRGIAYSVGLLALLAVVVISAGVSLLQGHDPRTALVDNTLMPVLLALYIAIPISVLLLVRSGMDGLLWINVIMWNVWFTDSWALLGGRAWGKTRLAPRISPGKTVEGALVGMGMGITAGTIITVLSGKPLLLALALNISISLLTVAGDLFESLLKRYFNVKDSSGLLPGHGGFLDRIDGFLLSAPVFYALLMAFGVL